MIPDMLAEVERCKADFPRAWQNAHTGNAGTEDFIRLLAARLYEIDARFGLNGKRGNPNDISDDAINYIGEGPGHDPITGLPVTVFDVIRSAGAVPPYTPANPAPSPSWDAINQPGPGAWVKPGQPSPPTPQPPNVQPYPSESPDGGWWGQVADAQIAETYARVGRPYPSDQKSLRWIGRIAYDIRDGMTKEASLDKHLAELRTELGLP